MKRRTFLKLVGFGIAAATLPLKLVEALTPAEYVVRETIGYDVENDLNYVRYDVSTGIERFYIAFSITDTNDIDNYRKIALDRLKEKLLSKGWNLTDLQLLPLSNHEKAEHYIGVI